MGCVQKQNIKLESHIFDINTFPSKFSSPIIKIDKKEDKSNKKEINYFNKITNKNLVNIIDFLNYGEIKEVGKVNKLFYRLLKQNEILIKRFKTRKSQFYSKIINGSNCKNIFSFSVLRNSNNTSDINSEIY